MKNLQATVYWDDQEFHKEIYDFDKVITPVGHIEMSPLFHEPIHYEATFHDNILDLYDQ